MNLYVIMKRTFDTEEKIVVENGRINDEDAEFIINPYDEYAIEEAIQLRDEHGGEVTVVTVGDEEAEKELRTALAMGCDKAVLIDTEEVEKSDQYTTSVILAKYFEDKEYDLILGGNVAVDNGTGQVGPRLAEMLDIAHVSTITKIDISGDKVSIERDIEGDVEVIETSLPLVVTTQQGLNDPRYPSLPGIMKAKKKPMETLDLDDLDLDEEDVEAKTETVERFLPPKKQAGKVLEGEINDQVKELVNLLDQKQKLYNGGVIMARKTLVLAEARDGELRNVSFEAIGAGKEVADGGEVVAVLCGEDIASLGKTLVHYGAERVLTIENEQLKNYTSDAYTQALSQVIESENPEAIIFGHTAVGKDLSSRLAGKLGSGLISDATAIEMEDGEVTFTRPIYSGKAFEKKRAAGKLIFATIRPNNIAAPQKDEGLSGEVSSFEVEIKDLRTVVKDIVRKTTSGVDLSEAKVIIAGGRGVKSEDGFQPLQELADVLGGAVGASRGAADAGYCDYSLQIGQTGKVVTPELYIACGISGAIQHLAGMSNSKVIVAINKDPEANIFNVADYGIVGDLFDVVPLLKEEFKLILSKS